MSDKVTFRLEINGEPAAVYNVYVEGVDAHDNPEDYQDGINDLVDKFTDFARAYFLDREED